VNELIRALHALDLKPVLEYSNGGLDANWLAEHGVYVATSGAGSLSAHTGHDSMDVRQFLTGCRVGLSVATGR
jgi:tripeptide aminopeptidase